MVQFDFSSKKIKHNRRSCNGYGETRANANFAYGTWSKFKNISGVYSIKCKITNKQYIGSTTNLQVRIGKHFSNLHIGNHPNKALQKDYNTYGFNDFEITCVKECSKDELLKYEREIQIEIGINNLYNEKISGYYISDELYRVYSNSDKSSHKTKEYREKMSKLKSNKIAQYDLDRNLIKVWDSALEICNTLGYTRSVILSGCNGNKKHPYGFYWRYLDDKGHIKFSGYKRKQS